MNRGFPTYDWKAAPEGLVTRRQLRARGLSPGGHGPVAQLRCRKCLARPGRTCTRMAWLYRADLARPKRVPTPAQRRALERAMDARRTCPLCRIRYEFCLPLRTLGSCWPCADPHPATARSQALAA
ncbi:RRQRL motif-containing zinc-binding protein [Streptomyces aidingensis]|uniref:Uncharacterized protein n=1 Tax=Streptomyces aidingensis TaxID=910347 RepID=A0A1I1UU92_9ACTN|nr:RRQRL motif-containing zinc-binding protein [Streptomyces aidingensis]SFD74347.1 hypothetical protein SAMN05421773_12716 [Streptomyces aidingensis]